MSESDRPTDPQRRRLLHWPLAAGLAPLLPGCATREEAVPAAPVAAAAVQVPPFSTAPAGSSLPPGWSPYVIYRQRAKTEYRLAEREGRRVLHARADRAASALQCALRVDPQQQPRLRWRWRADRLVGGARGDREDRDDAVARVGVGFDGPLAELTLRETLVHEQVKLFAGLDLPFQSLLYTWDDHLPVGSVWRDRRLSGVRHLVIQSGPDQLGQWVEHERDVLADHRMVFPEFAQRPVGTLLSLGCFTDSDDLGHVVEAWYDDLSLSA
ncbi:DUF3047 domain-containing protein [Piscinibacter sp. Jin2]|uniref:DUF3047 domain-containing protein n=1 Tax=Aquariibacter lacus TaxID=2801332 RepID=A0A9X0XFD7_9BURK|nr:DUF3047 domain-containing protein [Piscinibacter lacus]MBL0720591.1 DUF3047 domain-containing protein [Piscinibacter lacus]